MRRSFHPDPLPVETVDRLCDLARRAPSAGNAQGTDLVVLEGHTQTARYWDITLAEPRRASFAWPGLLDAPVLIVVVASPGAYVGRYGESDKVRSGLGEHADDWTVPFWFVDAGMVVENLLLAATDEGLGACFFGLFDHAPALSAELGIPETHLPVGTVAIGNPRGDDPPGRSAPRPRRPLESVVHRGAW